MHRRDYFDHHTSYWLAERTNPTETCCFGKIITFWDVLGRVILYFTNEKWSTSRGSTGWTQNVLSKTRFFSLHYMVRSLLLEFCSFQTTLVLMELPTTCIRWRAKQWVSKSSLLSTTFSTQTKCQYCLMGKLVYKEKKFCHLYVCFIKFLLREESQHKLLDISCLTILNENESNVL